jgi:long-subunit acyl-CoA synthetase (AMP-forming)
MGNFPDPIAASREIHSYTELREQSDVISQRLRRSSLPHAKKLAAAIVALTFVFWLGFDVATYHAPQANYPYYDTQKPVPPWSEPMPLEGNYARGEEHK